MNETPHEQRTRDRQLVKMFRQTKKENPTTPSRNNVNVTELASTAIEKATDQKKVTTKIKTPDIKNKLIPLSEAERSSLK